MELAEELERIAGAAARFAAPAERLTGVVAADPDAGLRLYLCAFASEEAGTSWLVLDDQARPVLNRRLVRDAATIAALCELAEENAAGGDLDELSAQLVSLRITENPPGIEEAEEALAALQTAIGGPPRVATAAHLDRVGAATRRLEVALGNSTGSPFVAAMRTAGESAQAFAADVEAAYKAPLE